MSDQRNVAGGSADRGVAGDSPWRGSVARWVLGAAVICCATVMAAAQDAPPEPSAPPAPPPPVSDAKGRLALTKTDGMLMNAHKAMFPVRVRTEQPGVFVRGHGFFVSQDGLAITQFHLLRGGLDATALLPGEVNPVKLELVSAEPDVDLALVRVKPEDLNPPRKLPFIAMADEAPDNGDSVWLLGISRFNRPTVDAGTFEAVVSHPALPEDTRTALPADHFSHWMQTSVKITLENSGGPIVNSKGQLLGLATYVWQTQTGGGGGGGPTRFVQRDPRGGGPSAPSTGQASSSKGLALSVAHIGRIIEGRDPVGIGFEGANRMYAAMPTIFSSLPRIETTVAPLVNIRNASNTFAEAAVCPLCAGEGVIEVEKKPQESKPLDGVSAPSASDQRSTNRRYDNFTPSPQQRAAMEAQGQTGQDQVEYKTCTRCSGSGFQQAANVLKLGGNVVEALSRADMTDREAQAAIVQMNIKLVEVLRHNPQRLIETLNNQARTYLHPRAMRLGTPVIFLGTLDDRETMPGKRGQLRSAMLGDTGPSVFIAEPDLADANPRDVVLVGGILAGYLTNEQGEPVPVLQRGFIVGIPQTDELGNELQEPPQPGVAGGAAGGPGGASATSSSSSGRGINSTDPRERFRAFMEMRQRGDWGRGR